MNQYSLRRYARFLYRWHGLSDRGSGHHAREMALDRLQGWVVPYSDLESHLLPARIADYRHGELDNWCRSGALIWQGHARLGAADGEVSIYRSEQAPRLARISGLHPGQRYEALRALLAREGPCDFGRISAALGGYPPQLLKMLWDMIWAGEVSNTRLLPLLSVMSHRARRPHRSWRRGSLARSAVRRPREIPGSGGEWYLVNGPRQGAAPPAERDGALIRQLLLRWGVIGRSCLQAERVRGGLPRFAAALSELEDEGRVRRGAFIEGWGAVQYGLVEAIELLGRSDREGKAWMIAAVDPANPFGRLAPWPKPNGPRLTPQRVAGAQVVLSDGRLVGYLSASGRDVLTFDQSERDPRSEVAQIVSVLATSARPDQATVLRTVDGRYPAAAPWPEMLGSAGFEASRGGYIRRVRRTGASRGGIRQ